MNAPLNCPCCGSDSIKIFETVRRIQVVYGSIEHYICVENKCNSCNESGDFFYQNDPQIKAALKRSGQNAIKNLLEELQEHTKFSSAERVLLLPQGTLVNWLKDPDSAPNYCLSLLRILHLHPEILNELDYSNWVKTHDGFEGFEL